MEKVLPTGENSIAVSLCPECSYDTMIITKIECNTCSQIVNVNPQNVANRNINMLFKIIDSLNQQINDLTARVRQLEHPCNT